MNMLIRGLESTYLGFGLALAIEHCSFQPGSVSLTDPFPFFPLPAAPLQTMASKRSRGQRRRRRGPGKEALLGTEHLRGAANLDGLG